MQMHMTGIETQRGNARALSTFACAPSAIARGVRGGIKQRGLAFVGDGMA